MEGCSDTARYCGTRLVFVLIEIPTRSCSIICWIGYDFIFVKYRVPKFPAANTIIKRANPKVTDFHAAQAVPVLDEYILARAIPEYRNNGNAASVALCLVTIP